MLSERSKEITQEAFFCSQSTCRNLEGKWTCLSTLRDRARATFSRVLVAVPQTSRLHYVSSTTEKLHRWLRLSYKYVCLICPFPCHRRQVVELWGDGPTVEEAAEAVRAFPEERKEVYFVEDASWSISVRKEVYERLLRATDCCRTVWLVGILSDMPCDSLWLVAFSHNVPCDWWTFPCCALWFTVMGGLSPCCALWFAVIGGLFSSCALWMVDFPPDVPCDSLWLVDFPPEMPCDSLTYFVLSTDWLRRQVYMYNFSF